MKVPRDLSPFDAIYPRLRLFLSVDLVGSTGFKQIARYPLHAPTGGVSLAHRSGPWLPEILTFYSEFNREYAQEWAKWREEAGTNPKIPITAEPEFWKGNGDELLFTFQLNHPRDITNGMVPWVRAVTLFRRKLRERQKNLDVKSTVWLAGFPINNSEIVFEQDVTTEISAEPIKDPILAHYELLKRWYAKGAGRSGLIKDYIGPSIDTGFRLSTYSTPRKMVISADVALLITHRNLSKPGTKLPIHFDGKEKLEGVLGGRPYPILWVDLGADDDLSKAEDRLRQKQATTADQVKEFCDAFFRENAGHLLKPFIWGCDDHEFNEPPPNYLAQLTALVEKLEREATRYAAEVRSITAPPERGADARQQSDIKDFTQHLKKRGAPKKAPRPRQRRKPKQPMLHPQ